MKRKIGSLLLALTMLAASLNMTAFAKQSDEDTTLNAQYTYTNNGYTLEKVSHADVAAGSADGFVDYYQYTDPDGKICTGEEAAQCIGCLARRIRSVGAEIVIDRGDAKP